MKQTIRYGQKEMKEIVGLAHNLLSVFERVAMAILSKQSVSTPAPNDEIRRIFREELERAPKVQGIFDPQTPSSSSEKKSSGQ